MHSAAPGESVEAIRVWVGDKLGLRFEHERSSMLQQRLELVCKKLRISLRVLRARLDSGDHALAIALAEELSTNHTLFQREPEMFALLGTTILPSLEAVGELRIWSAAASSGEEAYSLAMCASDSLGLMATRERVRILGTDISARQIQRAERAVYDLRGVLEHAPDWLSYFESVGPGQVRVRSELSKLCVFRRMNLAQLPWPFQKRFHVIFLRNILYYFDAAMRQRVLQACFLATEPGGWLVTSVTEPILGMRHPWTTLLPGVLRKPGAGA